jgi:asparagine N-glycosylation enzyme membrane subunit Stt3
MGFVSLDGASVRQGFTRPIVQSLFVATCLLSVVSFYTTQQGMALYLSPWFATLAALGIQVALVMVAWLVGLERARSPLLISVYVVTALVSVAFSYVSLHRWFSSRERPAEIQRALYDELNGVAGKTGSMWWRSRR